MDRRISKQKSRFFFTGAVLCMCSLAAVLAIDIADLNSAGTSLVNMKYFVVIGGQNEQNKILSAGGMIDRDYGGYFTAWFDNGKAGFEPTKAFSIKPARTVSVNCYQFDPTRTLPEIPRRFHGKSSERFHIVQFSGPVPSCRVSDLKAAGVGFKAYLPDYAYIIKADTGQLAAIESHAEVRAVSRYLPAFKLDPRLVWSAGEMLHVCLRTWSTDEVPSVIELVAQEGGFVRETCEWIMEAIVPGEAIVRIAEHDSVRTIELIEECQSRLCCYNGAWEIQTNISEDFKIWDKGLHGEGLTLGIIDGGLEIRHEMFRDPDQSWVQFSDQSAKYGPNYSDPGHRKVANYWVHPQGDEGPSLVASVWHGTGVNGIAAGDNSKAGNSSWAIRKDGRGMAYEARIAFVDISPATSAGSIPSTTMPWFGYILEYDNARVSSGSWVMTSGNYYHTSCVDADTMLWENKKLCLIFSNGHKAYSRGTSPSENRETCGSPASAKNVVAATALGNSKFAFGPARDGRVKPSIRAPYYLSTAYAPNWATNGYMVIANIGGTSSAAPVVNGGLALIRQYLLEGWYPTGTKTPADSMNPSGALLRAVLYAGAREYEGDKCDYLQEGINVHNNSQGWGDIHLDGSLFFSGDSRKLLIFENESGLGTGEQDVHAFSVTSLGEPVRVILVYTDYPGVYCTTTAPTLVNDLDLVVGAPSGRTYLGNVFEGKSPTRSVEGGSRDGLNNEEGCIFPTADYGLETGRYTITVSAVNVPMGPQPYAIAVTGAIEETAPGPAPPSVVIEQPQSGATAVFPDITIAGSASVNPPAGYVTLVEVRLNSGNWWPVTGTENWSVALELVPGSNTVEARATDNCGSVGSTACISIIHDSQANDVTPPVLSLVQPASGSITGFASVTVSGTAADPGDPFSGIACVEVRVNSQDWLTATGAENWSVPVSLEEDENVIEARAVDRAGNTGQAVVTIVEFIPGAAVIPKDRKGSFGCSISESCSRSFRGGLGGLVVPWLLLGIGVFLWRHGRMRRTCEHLVVLLAFSCLALLCAGCDDDSADTGAAPAVNTPPKIKLETPEGVTSGVVAVPVTVWDAQSDEVALSVWFSCDIGQSWAEASLVGTPELIKGSPFGTCAYLHWNSVADGVGLSQPCATVQLKAEPSDEDRGYPAFTMPFVVDNTQPNSPPAATIETPDGIQDGNIMLAFCVTDADSDSVYVEIEYSIDSGGTFAAIDPVPGYEVPGWFDADPTGLQYEVEWNTIASQVGFLEPAQVIVRVMPRDAQAGQGDQTASFCVDNTAAVTVPGIFVNTPEGEQSGDVHLQYVLYDEASDLLSIEVQFSGDGGATFSPATPGVGGDGLSGLSSSPAGEGHKFVWNSAADRAGVDLIETDVVVRITPSDAIATGLPGVTGRFVVNNGGFDLDALTVHVDASFQGGNQDGTREFPYVSIQAAVDAAPPGWRVRVGPGVYNESVLLKDGVDMIGCPEDPLSVLVVDQGDPLHKLGAFRSDENGKIDADIIGFTLTGLEGKG